MFSDLVIIFFFIVGLLVTIIIPQRYQLFVVPLIISFISYFGSYYGVDSENYIELLENRDLDNSVYSIGLWVISGFISSYYILVALSAYVLSFGFINYVSKIKDKYLVLFLFLPQFILDFSSLIKQNFAIGFVFISFRYFRDHNYIFAFLFILLAFLFHPIATILMAALYVMIILNFTVNRLLDIAIIFFGLFIYLSAKFRCNDCVYFNILNYDLPDFIIQNELFNKVEYYFNNIQPDWFSVSAIFIIILPLFINELFRVIRGVNHRYNLSISALFFSFIVLFIPYGWRLLPVFFLTVLPYVSSYTRHIFLIFCVTVSLYYLFILNY